MKTKSKEMFIMIDLKDNHDELVVEIEKRFHELGYSSSEIIEKFERAGGSERYTLWMNEHKEGVVDDWTSTVDYSNMSAIEIAAEGAVIGMMQFLSWVKKLN